VNNRSRFIFQDNKAIEKLLKVLNIRELPTNHISGTAGTAFVKVGGIGLSFLVSMVLARLLGASGYGSYAYAVSWAMLLSVPAGLGLDVLLIREVARNHAMKNHSAVRAVLRWSARAVLLSSTVIVLLAATGIWFFHESFELGTTDALWLALFILPLLALVRLQQGALQGLGRVVSAHTPQLLLIPTALVVLVGVLSFAGYLTAPLAVAAYGIAAGFAWLYSGWLLRDYFIDAKNYHVQSPQAKDWLRSALPLFVVATAGTLNDLVSVILLGALSGSESAGIFDVARKIAILASFGVMTISIPLAPMVASLYASGHQAQLQELVTRSTRVALLVSLPVAVILIAFGNWVLSIFGLPFQTGHAALAILCIGHLANAYMGFAIIVLNMTGYERDVAQGIIIAAIVNTFLCVLLIPPWGILGAAVANVVGTVAFLVLLSVKLYQRLGIRPAFVPT
jgi:O-antigen/teichoic acid export membrane protein